MGLIGPSNNAPAIGRATLLQQQEHAALLSAASRLYAHALSALQRRQRSQAARGFASLPDHTVVGLPALSPTMTHGNLAQWHKKEGDDVGPGDVFCDIETDKATIAFEAQDEGVLAKILVEEGTGDIAVGSPIMVRARMCVWIEIATDAESNLPPTHHQIFSLRVNPQLLGAGGLQGRRGGLQGLHPQQRRPSRRLPRLRKEGRAGRRCPATRPCW